MQGGADAEIAANSVAVKLPTFWVRDPELWFLQTEAVFVNRQPRITKDETKFNFVVMALPQEVFNSCKQVIRMDPAIPNRYERLKAVLTSTYGKTKSQRHCELIEYAATKTPVLDVKPSNMLMYVRDMAGQDSQEAFLRTVLLNRLPDQVRTTLSNTNFANNDDLDKQADKVMEAFLQSNAALASSSVAAVAADQADDVRSAPFEVAAVTSKNAPPFLCFIHAKYGPKAFSCRSSQCPMRNQVQRRRPAPGNDNAGR